ncbi:ATP synthase F0 subcomplex B subunit [Arachidicoccus rhizosphaerae]|uniref:ATP synthase subunit b n=1 Tax=Arachidicoccus rhizosphaerae TaxID=551991 RepID=A0A1H3XE71_9BACT|nr:F0F1 ATP synthase subunit B [Arachidicoccus rhizosphaerae]SDZ96848.1 ATP synthase F0 subcomplex B subunit [Arachidicoccus rhizosphaerae]
MGLLTPDFGLFFWTLIAFLLVLFVLGKFAWKPILNSLSEREDSITKSLATAEQARKEMASLKSENETLLQKAREERSLMLKEAKDNAEKLISDATAKAKSEYERIVADAQAAISQQKQAALTDVKNQVGNLVIEVAEKVLRKQLSNKGEQEALIKDLVDNVKLN